MRNPFAGIEWVLFDLDGTLIDTHIDFPQMRAEMVRLACESGCAPDDLEGLDILAIVGECGARLERAGSNGQSAAYREAAYAALRRIEVAQCADPAEVEGAADLLALLRDMGVGVGIVTRNCREVAEDLVRRGRLACDALVTRDDVERTKPDPEHLHAALRAMGARLPRRPSRGGPRSMMVGDHWMDVAAGRAAGCRTVGLLRGRPAGVFGAAVPDVLAEGVASLVPMVESLRSGVSRRSLITSAGVGAVMGPALSRGTDAPASRPGRGETEEPERMDVPSYCTHEHWGSVASFGMEPEGFRPDVLRGATPLRRTGTLDLLLDPYFGGWLACSGLDVAALARDAGVGPIHDAVGRDAGRALLALRPALTTFGMTGGFRALREGILRLYRTDIAECSGADAARLDERVAREYADTFGWYRKAMRRSGLVHPIRPVHPEFIWRVADSAQAGLEAQIVRPILRVDPLVQLWPASCPRRDALAAQVGVEPGDAPSWRRFLGVLFDRAASIGCVGIKQLQAYARSLAFDPVADADVAFRGDLDARQRKAFEDWVVHECCKQAHDRGWPHQVHVGTHNLSHSSPLPLGGLAQRYRRMALVQLHCWPFVDEAGWLAWQHPNVYVDGCWMPIINPHHLAEALSKWLGMIPYTKVMCGHDATSVEMAVGASTMLRSILETSLAEHRRNGTLSASDAAGAARAVLCDNAVRIYGAPRDGRASGTREP